MNEYINALEARNIDGTLEEKEEVFEYFLLRQLKREDNMKKFTELPLVH